MLVPLVAERLPGPVRLQLMVPLAPVRVALKFTGAPPAVTVVDEGLMERVGAPPPAPQAAKNTKSTEIAIHRKCFILPPFAHAFRWASGRLTRRVLNPRYATVIGLAQGVRNETVGE